MLLQVHVKRSVLGEEVAIPSESDKSSHFVKPPKPLVRKSKLVLVDLAGSERVQKSGAYIFFPSSSKSVACCISKSIFIFCHLRFLSIASHIYFFAKEVIFPIQPIYTCILS